MRSFITAIVLTVTGAYLIGKTMSEFVGGSTIHDALEVFGIY